MDDKTLRFIEQNKNRFLDELKTLLKIPSVSADSKYKEDVLKCAQWLVNHLKNLHLDARLIETKGHPIVYAEAKGKSDKTLLIYGHYDVQPPDPLDKWHTDPFTPTIRDGCIYARGATDDKGQLFAHVKALETIQETIGKLPCNLIFLIEGEEECGAENLAEYIKDRKEALKTDAVVISDTSMYDESTPAITYALRGILAMEIKVTTAAADLHSGVFGGAVANPVFALSVIISRCIAPDGKILIPGFYDDVKPLEDWEEKNFQNLNFDEKTLLKQVGAKKVFGDPAFSTLERLWARPTFDINGVFGGYTAEGMKTIIPSCASAKITIRLVPDQNPGRVADLVIGHLKSVCPHFAEIDIQGPSAGAEPVLFDIKNPVIKAGFDALKAGFGAEPVYIRCGGSIPVVNTFVRQLDKPVILMGFGLDSDGAHSVNEKFKIDNFINGIKSSVHLLTNF